MLTVRRAACALLVVLFAATGACDDAALSGPQSDVVSPTDIPANSNAATTQRGTFSFLFGGTDGVTLPAACLDLSDGLLITGRVSGQFKLTETSQGHFHLTEYLDFSDLTATGNGLTWNASPGAHEIFQFNLGEFGEYAVNVTHEGHSVFMGEGAAPDFRLVHRIHQVLTPNFDLTVNEITPLSVQCLGNAG